MFFTNLIVGSAAIVISLNCFADGLSTGIENYVNSSFRLKFSDDNFDDVLQKLGVEPTLRTKFEEAVPTLNLTQSKPSTKNYTLHEESKLWNETVSFQVGVKLNRKTVDGRQIENLFTLRNSTLTETQTQAGKPTLTIHRLFLNTGHVVVFTQIEDVVSYRIYDLLLSLD